MTHNDVSVVTNVWRDHLGQQGIDTVDQLAEVRRSSPRSPGPPGWSVLNGDDPRVWAMRMAPRAKPWVFTLDPDSPAIREALGAGGRAITVLDGWVTVLDEHRVHDRLVAVVDLPMALSGLSVHNVANALAVRPHRHRDPARLRRRGPAVLRARRSSQPGRMNTYTVPVTVGTATVIVDLAHNEAGLDALLDVCHGLCAPGAKVRLALGTAGDRTDDILRSLGEIAGRRADEVNAGPQGALPARSDHRGRWSVHCARACSVSVSPMLIRRPPSSGMTRLLANAHDGDVVAVMCHSERAAIAEWIAAHGGRPDDAAAIRHQGCPEPRRASCPGRHRRLVGRSTIHKRGSRRALLFVLRIRGSGGRLRVCGHLRLRRAGGRGRRLYEEALTVGSVNRCGTAASSNLASTLRNLGRLDEATARIEDAVAAEPTSIGAWMFRAMILHDAGRATEGLRGLLEVVAAESSDADVQRYRRSLTAYAAELGDRVSP